MATTNLIVDYLIIGVTGFIWIVPMLLLVQGNKWLSFLGSINVVTGFLLLGFIYILGISVSRLADDVMKRWNDRLRDNVFGEDSDPGYHNRLNLIIAKSVSASDYLSYRRSIIRISRACSLNFFVGFLLWIVVAWVKPIELPNGTEIIISAFSLIVFSLLIRAYPVVLKGYFYTIKDIYGYLRKDQRKSDQ